MSWSWRIGRIAGIDLYMHFTFLILLGWVALAHYLAHGRVEDALLGVAFIVCLFGIVILHELGHALTARRFGIATRDITLLPIGGVARLERMPEDPRQEMIVAFAGPAVNVVLAAVLFLIVHFGAGLEESSRVMQVGGDFLNQMLWVNVILAVFNLLPAFPMDGGRVLRALLAMRMDYVRATQIAATIGQGIALLFGFIGLFMNPFLVFIALFVWMGAAQEASVVQMRAALHGIPVEKGMVTDFRTLQEDDPLERAIEHVLAGFQQDFPVVRDGQITGVLTHGDLIAALARHGAQIPVGEVMRREFETADSREMLEGVLTRLQSCHCRSVPVLRNGTLVGIVTPDNLSELLMIREALRKSR